MTTHVKAQTAAPSGISAPSAFRWALDRCVAVTYGFVQDLIVERFTPYRALEREVLALVEAATPPGVDRRAMRILHLNCGTGAFTVTLAEAGFSTIGVDCYTPLLDVARERRRARGLTHLGFSKLDIGAFHDDECDQVVSIHGLYVEPAPARVVAEVARILKPGGHAVFVNHVARFAPWATFRAARRSAGLLPALKTLLWLIPNVLFEAARRPVGPHYWDEREFTRQLRAAGFTVLELRRTFLADGSLLAWARKDGAVMRAGVESSAPMAWNERKRPPARWTERGLERAIAFAYGATYDAVVHGFAPYERLLDDVVDVLARTGNGQPLRILDVACGTGTVARHLARAGHIVVGVDPVAHLVERARRRAGGSVAFAPADIADGIAFPAASFDACVSLHTINWHPRPAAVLAECQRLVRPGGYAVVLSYTRPASLAASFVALQRTEGLRAAVSALRWLIPTSIFEACRHYTPRYPTGPVLHREVMSAGFKIVESRPVFLAGLSRLVVAVRLAELTSPISSPGERTS